MTDSYSPRARIPSREMATKPQPTSIMEQPIDVRDSRQIPPAVAVVRPGAPNIAKAISAIETEIGVVDKAGKNVFFNYRYARIEDILEALTPLMGKHGLAIFQNEIDVQQIESRVAVKYEFTVIHTSGEVYGPFYKYGMSNARDSKGNFDDKCINKAHTQARRYFLVGLFQIPTAELDDNERSSEKPKQRAPVPARAAPRNDLIPRKLVLGAGVGADKWAEEFIKCIGTATSPADIAAWDKCNKDALSSLAEGFDQVYERVCVAIETKLKQFKADSAAVAAAENVAAYMPDPQKDAIAATNWVGQQLNDIKTPEALEAFWTQVIEPAQSKFLPPDYEVLLSELRRAEARLGIEQGGADEEAEVHDQTRP